MGGAVQAATTMTIDVLGPDTGRKVNITLYLADWERLGRELAVETREYGNLQLATPTTRVRNFTEGCKLRFEVQVPIRFRLMEVAAPLPHNFAPLALSALFFDALDACDLRNNDLSGVWKDPRNDGTWNFEENTTDLTFKVSGPWAGEPHGQLHNDGSVWLTFSPTNTATGQLNSCDSIVWTDVPDKKAGNTW